MKTPSAPVKLPIFEIIGRARAQLAPLVDGRYGAMDPAELQSAIALLARETDLAGVEYVLGIPEGGYLPAYAFAAETGLRVVLASVFRPNMPGVVTFLEEHEQPSLSSKHVYGLSAGDHVIVVEDEVTTGRTVVNCVRALRGAGIQCDQVVTIYAADDPGMRARLAAEGIRLHAAALCLSDTNDRLYRR